MLQQVWCNIARGHVQVSCHDVILAFSLVHSRLDIVRKWDAFSQCSKPLHVWLLVSYAAMLAFRAAHQAGQCSSTTDSIDLGLPHLRRRDASWFFTRVTWFLILPFFAAWTLLRTSWSLSNLDATLTCLPAGIHSWFIFFWQVLCYVWIATYSVFVSVTCQYEKSLDAMEKDHHRVAETEDALRRWGQVPFLPDCACLKSQGLSRCEIQSLPRVFFSAVAGKSRPRQDCAICLMEFQPQDLCRQLPGCGHLFHESCIDLWLLRRGDCPLCKNRIQ